MHEKKLPYKTVHNIMKENTDMKVSRESVLQTIYFLENLTKTIAKVSSIYTKHGKRKTITSQDINQAIQYILNNSN